MIEILFFFSMFSVIGVAQEVFWRAAFSKKKTRYNTLMGESSIWMFPIYGCVFFIILLGQTFFPSLHFLLRGFIYMIMIYALEYSTGFMLKKMLGKAPWDYSYKCVKIKGKKIRTNLHGIICLEYSIIWFVESLLAEALYILLKSHIAF